MNEGIQRLLDISPWLVAFVRAAILGEPSVEPIPDDFDWDALYALSVRQKLSAVTWRGIRLSNCSVPNYLQDKWEIQSQHAISKEIRFDYEYDLIVQGFEQAAIPYVPLKGRLIRAFWPDKGLREFSDIDILVHEEDQQRAGEILIGLGYTADHLGGMHDVYKKPPIYNIELHQRLIESYIEFGHHFDNIWDRVVPSDSACFAYEMTPTDFYLHFLLHFLKHHLHEGTGLRFFVDLFLLRRSGFIRDEEVEQVHTVIVQLNLWDDLLKIYQITDDLFIHNCNISKEYCKFIFSGNAYGNVLSRIHNAMETEGGKTRYIFKRIFMPYSYMCKQYKVLTYVPILLPFLWVYRWIHHLFSRKHRKNIASEIRGVRNQE